MPTMLYIGQSPAHGTGSPVIVLRHLRRFAAAGWNIQILADYGADSRDCLAAGWSVHSLCHRRWWWPPYRQQHVSLRWLRLRLLAREAAAIAPAPDVILSYLAAHSDFSAHLAAHVSELTGTPLHMLVHDDAAAFPSARGREMQIRRAHEDILHAATASWFVSPELADCFPTLSPCRRVLYPIPEGWDRPASWTAGRGRRPRVYYAGHVWPEQVPVLARAGHHVRAAGGELVVMTRESSGIHALCADGAVRWHAPFATNREALAHLAADASAVLVSYADAVADMPWSATSFPSKFVEYCHLGLPVAVVAPSGAAIARWAHRVRFPHAFDPVELDRLEQWCAGLASRETWLERAALSLQLARTEFDPDRIHAELTSALVPASERRAA